MNIGFLLRTGPYSYENTDVVYHLSKSFLKKGNEVSIFFFEDGVINLVKDIKSSSERNLSAKMQELSDLEAVLSGCGACAKFRGIKKSGIIEGATLSGLATLSKFVRNSDRFITLGY